jgi:UDP-N-acetylmuramyl pentapeptide phosphotransferase/UDP-N-acetylglucosamine-1-phosphate transferase
LADRDRAEVVARLVACTVAAACFLAAFATDSGLLSCLHGNGSRRLLAAPMAAAAVLTAGAGAAFIPLLRRLRASQTVRANGPESHLAKTGTPTAGGIFVVPCGLFIGLVASLGKSEPSGSSVLVAVAGTAALGIVGLVDDILKIFRRSSGGLSGGRSFHGLSLLMPKMPRNPIYLLPISCILLSLLPKYTFSLRHTGLPVPILVVFTLLSILILLQLLLPIFSGFLRIFESIKLSSILSSPRPRP